MVKLVFLCRRRPDVSHEQYVDMLLAGHVPLALAHHPTLRRYVVNIVDSTRGPAPALDSIGELWFDSLADYRERLYDSSEGDGSSVATSLVFSVPPPVRDERARAADAGRRSTGPVARRARSSSRASCACPGSSREAFATHWLERHARWPSGTTTRRANVTNVVRERLSGDAAEYDGFAELTFPPGEMQRHMYLTPDGQREVEADIPRFIGSVHAYVVTEHVARW
jgi:hypothetical protein